MGSDWEYTQRCITVGSQGAKSRLVPAAANPGYELTSQPRSTPGRRHVSPHVWRRCQGRPGGQPVISQQDSGCHTKAWRGTYKSIVSEVCAAE